LSLLLPISFAFNLIRSYPKLDQDVVLHKLANAKYHVMFKRVK